MTGDSGVIVAVNRFPRALVRTTALVLILHAGTHHE